MSHQERFPEEHTAIDRFFELMHSCSRPTFYYVFIKVKNFLRILITGSIQKGLCVSGSYQYYQKGAVSDQLTDGRTVEPENLNFFGPK